MTRGDQHRGATRAADDRARNAPQDDQIGLLCATSLYARMIERAIFALGHRPQEFPGAGLVWEVRR